MRSAVSECFCRIVKKEKQNTQGLCHFDLLFIIFQTEVDKETQEPLPMLTKETREWCAENGLPLAETVTDVIAAAERGAERSNPSTNNGNISVQDTQALRFVQAIDTAIERANRKAISGAQRIQKWAILPVDLSIPGGELGNYFTSLL